jgi:hypothetical protein
MSSAELIQAVAVTAELCGRTFSEAAAKMFVQDLSGFDEQAVIKALTRCRREVRGFLTIADVVSRIDDGRPGVEEAWAMMPFDESQTVVWTEDMAKAFGIALPLLMEGDKVAARMAFKESYAKLVTEARDAGIRVTWTPSLGHDKNGREAVLSEAVAKGRLTYEAAQEFIPQLTAPEKILAMIGRNL